MYHVLHSVPIKALSSGSLYTRYFALCGDEPVPPSKQFFTCASCNGADPMSARFTPQTGQLRCFSKGRICVPRNHLLGQITNLRTCLPMPTRWARDLKPSLVDNDTFYGIGPRCMEPIGDTCVYLFIARLTDSLRR